MNKYIDKDLSRGPYIHFATIENDWNAIILGNKRVGDNCLNYNIFKIFSSYNE